MYGILEEETMVEYKVGDKVRVVKAGSGIGGSHHQAEVGSIDTVTEIFGDYGVKGETWAYFEDEIEPASDCSESNEQPKFKVGDRVRATKYVAYRDVTPGNVFEVESTDHEGATMTDDVYLYNTEFELVTAPQFSPGDRVRVKEHYGYFAAGDVGEVEALLGDLVFVKHGPYQYRGLPLAADNLELVARADEESLGDILQRELADARHYCAERNEQQEQKFKAGDQVRMLMDDWLGSFHVGDVFTLTGASDRGVEFVDGDGDDRWRPVDEVELVPAVKQDNELASFCISGDHFVTGTIYAKPQPCIVALTVDGHPRPSSYPYIHASVAAATTEAERLARINPGQEFAVYQRVTGRTAEVQYNMKEVA